MSSACAIALLRMPPAVARPHSPPPPHPLIRQPRWVRCCSPPDGDQRPHGRGGGAREERPRSQGALQPEVRGLLPRACVRQGHAHACMHCTCLHGACMPISSEMSAPPASSPSAASAGTPCQPPALLGVLALHPHPTPPHRIYKPHAAGLTMPACTRGPSGSATPTTWVQPGPGCCRCACGGPVGRAACSAAQRGAEPTAGGLAAHLVCCVAHLVRCCVAHARPSQGMHAGLVRCTCADWCRRHAVLARPALTQPSHAFWRFVFGLRSSSAFPSCTTVLYSTLYNPGLYCMYCRCTCTWRSRARWCCTGPSTTGRCRLRCGARRPWGP